MHTHTNLARLDKDNRLGNNQSNFSRAFEDIYGETDHYSCTEKHTRAHMEKKRSCGVKNETMKAQATKDRESGRETK